MYETRKNQHKKVLGDLSLVEEIVTTVASVSYTHLTLPTNREV